MKERVIRITNWLKDAYVYDREISKFNRFFRQSEKPNGVLTQPGKDISPTVRALITAKNRIPILTNYLVGDAITEEQMQRLRHAVFFSLRGNYDISPFPEREGVRVGISLEDSEAHSCLSTNTGTAVAFLKYFNGHLYRYQQSSSIETNEGNNFPQVTLDFSKANSVPSSQRQLYIFIQPAFREMEDKRFTKMILPLII